MYGAHRWKTILKSKAGLAKKLIIEKKCMVNKYLVCRLTKISHPLKSKRLESHLETLCMELQTSLRKVNWPCQVFNSEKESRNKKLPGK